MLRRLEGDQDSKKEFWFGKQQWAKVQSSTPTNPKRVNSVKSESCAFVLAFHWLIVCVIYKQTAQLKQFQEQHQKVKDFSSPSSSAMGTQSSAPPPQPPPPKESFARRYKFLWPMLLAVNLAVGGPFLSLFPQSSAFSFIFMYICVCLFLYKVIEFLKWCNGFWDFSLKEWSLSSSSVFLDVFVHGYSAVSIGVMVNIVDYQRGIKHFLAS